MSTMSTEKLRELAEEIHVEGQNRCAICFCPLAESADKGCVRGNCSQRGESSEYPRNSHRARVEAILAVLKSSPLLAQQPVPEGQEQRLPDRKNCPQCNDSRNEHGCSIHGPFYQNPASPAEPLDEVARLRAFINEIYETAVCDRPAKLAKEIHAEGVREGVKAATQPRKLSEEQVQKPFLPVINALREHHYVGSGLEAATRIHPGTIEKWLHEAIGELNAALGSVEGQGEPRDLKGKLFNLITRHSDREFLFSKRMKIAEAMLKTYEEVTASLRPPAAKVEADERVQKGETNATKS